MTGRTTFCSTPQAGFSLAELVIVVVVLAILSFVAITNLGSPSDLSVPSQAQKMASDIQFTQAKAHTIGNPTRLTVDTAAGSYASCIWDAGRTICSDFLNITLRNSVGLTLVGAAPTTINFDTSGTPDLTDSASYRLTAAEGSTATVSVAPLTGFVSVTTP